MEDVQYLVDEIFGPYDVRIAGTGDYPLFVAVDIAEAIGIKDISSTIAGFGLEYKINVLIDGSMQVVLTELGLCAVIFGSPEAKRYQADVFDLIKRKPASEDDDDDYYSITSANDEPIYVPNSKAVRYRQADYDVDMRCIYLIHVSKDNYKYGVSGDVLQRLKTHGGNFKRQGYMATAVAIWELPTRDMSYAVETQIKRRGKAMGITNILYGHTEILTGDLDGLLGFIDGIVSEATGVEPAHRTNTGKPAKVALKKVDHEHIYKINEIEIQKSEIALRRLELEVKMVEMNNQLDREKMAHQLMMSDRAAVITPEMVAEVTSPSVRTVTNTFATLVTPATTSAKEREINAANWIRSNPPKHKEVKKDYYKRYCMDNSDDDYVVADTVFGKVMKNEKYVATKNNCIRYWNSK
jgi:predicted GIY-YIG superfamily endonuclease